MEDAITVVEEAFHQLALKDIPPKTLQQFVGIPLTAGFESITACSNVTGGLLARGYSEEAVKRIMGGNWLRLYNEVWQS